METIEDSPLFQRKGIFNERIYSEMLKYVLRTQARIYEEQTRQNIMLSKLYQKVTDNISLSDKEIAEEYRKNNQQVSVYYLAALVSDFSKNINISDDELKDYFAKNQLDFKQPLSFKIEYVFWSEEDKDAETLKNKAEAMQGKKEDFLKTAKELGLESKETDFFGQADPIPGIGWSPEILVMLSKVKPGELLPIIHADKNYYLVRLKEKKEPYVPDFQEIKDKVKEIVVKNTAWETAKIKIESALLGLKQNADLEQTAKATSLKYDSTNPFTYGSYIEGIGISDNFWLKAEELKEGDYSGIIKMPSGFYIIALKSKTPVDEKKFTAEKEEFTGKLLLQKKQEYFSPYFEELKNKSQKL
jgi:peptidyl-prolyl cis-trans isomerase D